MSVDIVVTGLGALGAWGVGKASLAEALACGAPPRLSPVDRGAGYHRPGGSTQALLLGPQDLSTLVPPAAARRMGAPSRMALAAARLALRDAALAEGDPDFAATAVVVATVFGPALFTERLLLAILRDGPETASPALFTESVASAAASQVALNLKALGPNVTITEREAGSLQAVAEGARLLRRGRAQRALVGVVEEMTPLLHAILDRFHALAVPDAHGAEVARPFDRDRGGVLAAEGAAMLLVERAADAERRGATVLCRVIGGGSGFDPTAPDNGFGGDPEGIGERLRQGVERAGVAIADIDRIVSGAAGACAADRVEALALGAAWRGAPLPPIFAPKAATGEWGGGHLAAAILAAGGATFGPTHGFVHSDPDLGLTPHSGGELPTPRHTLVFSLAAGGAYSWLILAKP